ncbi:hypothetical protein AB0K35_03210 [Micromonospora sp. NPDC053740]|uniref:hypothetical protein n=1 Tax=Micromonospora TaxID=1873 RepID=UPI001EE7EF23|nr:hypothetical protein [Micromonospora alfalfae]MCG5461773.1 hypothetical protein [Micromonospora alfalfae]
MAATDGGSCDAVAGIETAGRPEGLPRTRCAEAQFQGLKELAVDKQDEGQVIVSGDLNVDFSADRSYGYAKFPWQVFEANELPNLRSNYNLYGEKGTGSTATGTSTTSTSGSGCPHTS